MGAAGWAAVAVGSVARAALGEARVALEVERETEKVGATAATATATAVG